MKSIVVFLSIVIAVALGIIGIVHYAETPTYAGDTYGDARGFIESVFLGEEPNAGQWKFVSQTKSSILGHSAWKIRYAHNKTNICYYEWVAGYWRQHTRGPCNA